MAEQRSDNMTAEMEEEGLTILQKIEDMEVYALPLIERWSIAHQKLLGDDIAHCMRYKRSRRQREQGPRKQKRRKRKGMGKTIRWSMKDPAGCVQRGQMPLSQLPGILRDFENSAAETLRRTGADHVLYAVKIYNTEDELTAVQFYMNPMSDEEFSKVAGKGRGTMIYALHSRKVKVAG